MIAPHPGAASPRCRLVTGPRVATCYTWVERGDDIPSVLHAHPSWEPRLDEPGIVSTRPGPRSDRLSNVRRALVAILILNLPVTAAKFGYGTWSGFVAMRADGLPSFPGGLAAMVALVTVAIAARPRTMTVLGMRCVRVAKECGDRRLPAVHSAPDAGQGLRRDDVPVFNAGWYGVILATMTATQATAVRRRRRRRTTGPDPGRRPEQDEF